MNIIDKLREPKIAGMAIFDWVATIAGAMLFAWATEDTGAQVPRWRYYILVIITFILLGLVLHKLFGQRTPLTEFTLGA